MRAGLGHGALAIAFCVAPPASAATLAGSALALRSGGAASGTDWQLTSNGYLGTYITVTQPGPVAFSVQAAGAGAGTNAAQMSLVIGDQRRSFAVDGGFDSYTATLDLPVGTHFVRTEFTNDVPNLNRTLAVRGLTATGSGVSFSNANNSASALASADTYIATGRRGAATVALVGASIGAPVRVKLVNHAFNFGGNVPGSSLANVNSHLNNPRFTGFFKEHFNTAVASNAGKWGNNEGARDMAPAVGMAAADAVLDFAEDNGLRARQHNLIWGDQQPAWMTTLLESSANNAAIREEISERIDYYVGDGDADTNDGDRARRYTELDVYNETYHTGSNNGTNRDYWSRFGVAGVADIYDEVAQAVAAAGADTKLYVNEYNILQNGADGYGNWYRQQIESIQNADGDPGDGPVSGIGMQLYPVAGHSAAYMQQVLQNLSGTGLPLSLTEFGVQDSVADEAEALRMIEDSMRMVFGTPDATTFMYWGFWAGATSSLQQSSVLVDAEWNLTAAGKLYEDLLGIRDWDGDPTNGWTTDLTAFVNPDGTIGFDGYFGDYEVTIGGQTYFLSLRKGVASYVIAVPEPATAAWAIAFVGAATRRRTIHRSVP